MENDINMTVNINVKKSWIKTVLFFFFQVSSQNTTPSQFQNGRRSGNQGRDGTNTVNSNYLPNRTLISLLVVFIILLGFSWRNLDVRDSITRIYRTGNKHQTLALLKILATWYIEMSNNFVCDKIRKLIELCRPRNAVSGC